MCISALLGRVRVRVRVRVKVRVRVRVRVSGVPPRQALRKLGGRLVRRDRGGRSQPARLHAGFRDVRDEGSAEGSGHANQDEERTVARSVFLLL